MLPLDPNDPGGRMRRITMARGGALGMAAALAMPAAAFAQDDPPIAQVADELNVTWIIVATVLVMFMQAGFALLEIGFSRGKNVGAGLAKILANFSIATIAWWAIGFGVAFGGAGLIAGTDGFFFSHDQEIGSGLLEGEVGGSTAAFMLFQFMFCAVSLAIVWGTTLERLKFVAYVIYAVVFAALIYPLSAHWIFGGGFLSEIGGGVQDFAGSTVVHLVGATGALAALLLLGPRRGKYGPDGKPRAIPGHSMPLVGLGVLILWLGWFGFNGGSTLGTSGSRFAEVMLVTQLGAAAGVIGACLVTYFRTKSLTSAWPATGRSPAWSASPPPPVTSSSGPLRSSAWWPACSWCSRSWRSRRSSTTRSARCRRTAWRGSGGPWRAVCSRRTGWPRRTASASRACSTPARSSSSACRRSAWAPPS
jgi:Amt family ammonium transporter